MLELLLGALRPWLPEKDAELLMGLGGLFLCLRLAVVPVCSSLRTP